jgi:hypothetical protein
MILMKSLRRNGDLFECFGVKMSNNIRRPNQSVPGTWRDGAVLLATLLFNYHRPAELTRDESAYGRCVAVAVEYSYFSSGSGL